MSTTEDDEETSIKKKEIETNQNSKKKMSGSIRRRSLSASVFSVSKERVIRAAATTRNHKKNGGLRKTGKEPEEKQWSLSQTPYFVKLSSPLISSWTLTSLPSGRFTFLLLLLLLTASRRRLVLRQSSSPSSPLPWPLNLHPIWRTDVALRFLSFFHPHLCISICLTTSASVSSVPCECIPTLARAHG